MADPHAKTRALLDERPEVETALEEILAVDADGPWSFDSVDVDSGTFGELVSRGIVEKQPDTNGDSDNHYRVVDHEAVRAALDGDSYENPPNNENASTGLRSQLGLRIQSVGDTVHRDLLFGLVGGFFLLFVTRIVALRRVFRDERVLLPGNDPYYYLYWVERLAEANTNPLDFEAIAEVLGGQGFGEPLVPTLGWWATRLAGGGASDAITVVAWLPVLCALVVGAGVYLLGLWTTNDERVGVLSVVVFALLPGHVLYSGIGFFDHHAFDYVWLTLSIGGVLWLARDHEGRDSDTRQGHLIAPTTWIVVGGLGLVFAAMVHSWNGSPILLVGLAVYATLRATSDMRAGWNPLIAATPLVSALGIGFVIAYALHTRAGWQEPIVVYSLALVAVGIAVVAGAATILGRFDVHPGVHLAVSVVSILPLWVGFEAIQPEAAARLVERATGALLGREGAVETRSLFAADFGVIFGPIDHFGWFLFVALPVIGVVALSCVRAHEPRWLVLVGYGTTLIGFGVIQLRFAGEATGVVAVFAGLGLVYLLSVIDLADRPTPFGSRDQRVQINLTPSDTTWQQAGYAIGAVVVVASLSLFMIPAITDSVAPTDAEASAIEWIDADATEREGPDYVLTGWGKSRMFNYAVNGEARSYSYAQTNYEPFIEGQNPNPYADRFSGRVGYVVIHEIDSDFPPESTYGQLFEARGSATAAANGSGRYQLSYVPSEADLVVHRLVAGATITGEAPPDTTVTVRTEAAVDGLDEPFTYERRTTAGENGTYSVVVAHSGAYEVSGEGIDSNQEPVDVSADAVQNGTQLNS
ncbi:STT3 domain-containing protein [Halorubrum halophilum]|uniref:STT3 domain-containing protein n=1 Tax=Halorubrum halophilum TaxID=413816 RepID=UPI000678E426|nr:STT3 domain-containing protein [Halorubrum halophilum]